MPSQRPFFLSTVFAAFRLQTPSSIAASTSAQQPNKQTSSATSAYSTSAAAAARSLQQQQQASSSTTSSSSSSSSSSASSPSNPQQPQQPRASGPIPVPRSASRRRGSDSSTEGFRNVRGADKWYVGGRTATGEERFFKLGVVRRIRSVDRLSLDRLSL